VTVVPLQTSVWSGVLVMLMTQTWPVTVALAEAEAALEAGSSKGPLAVAVLITTPVMVPDGV
jgi:hypothetical protein